MIRWNLMEMESRSQAVKDDSRFGYQTLHEGVLVKRSGPILDIREAENATVLVRRSVIATLAGDAAVDGHQEAWYQWELGHYTGSGPAFGDDPDSVEFIGLDEGEEADGTVYARVRVTYEMTVPVTLDRDANLVVQRSDGTWVQPDGTKLDYDPRDKLSELCPNPECGVSVAGSVAEFCWRCGTRVNPS